MKNISSAERIKYEPARQEEMFETRGVLVVLLIMNVSFLVRNVKEAFACLLKKFSPF